MKIVKHAEGVYEIENFLTEEEQNALLSFTEDKGWIKSHPGSIVKRITDLGQIEVSKTLTRLGKLFTNMDSFTRVTDLRRLTVGESMPIHVDGGDPENPKTIVFGIAIYVNDDFKGGELFYLDLGLSVVPKARSVVIHDAKLRHKVRPVISGNRYSITAFVFGDESTRFNSDFLP